MKDFYHKTVEFIREVYCEPEDGIPLHSPVFNGNEKRYLNECIDSTFVSSIGKFVDDFEKKIEEYTACEKAVVIVNGTEALHFALKLIGVQPDDEVITQPLSFVATVNAISYCNANPVFVDVDKDTLGLSPASLDSFLTQTAEIKNNECFNKVTNKRIKACVPVHTFGHPCKIDEILSICKMWNIELIEDAAESIGSTYKGRHTGTFGKIGILSFNGNKTITSGGGGMLLTNDENLGIKAKHYSTQAKMSHPWEFIHDNIGFNLRMPNINAALGLAQLEQLDTFIKSKRELAAQYKTFFKSQRISFVTEPINSISNYWLNSILLGSRAERDEFLKYTNSKGINTRPAWRLLNKLEMYNHCISSDLSNAIWIEERLVNLPSSVR